MFELLNPDLPWGHPYSLAWRYAWPERVFRRQYQRCSADPWTTRLYWQMKAMYKKTHRDTPYTFFTPKDWPNFVSQCQGFNNEGFIRQWFQWW